MPEDPKPEDDPKPKDEPRKPWGTDSDFDPEKAWRLIENLKTDLEKVKSDKSALQSKIDEVTDKDKTEVQRLTDKVAQLESELGTERGRADRLEVALGKGLDAVQARRLVGTTKEELETDADELLSSFKAKDDESTGAESGPTRRPTEDLKGGGDPTREPRPDMREVVSSIPRDGV